MTLVRGVRPRQECAARSSGPQYASTSTSRPQRTSPSTCRTSTLPSRSPATSSVSRAKKSGPSTEPARRETPVCTHALYEEAPAPPSRGPTPGLRMGGHPPARTPTKELSETMATATVNSLGEIEAILGADADSLLRHRCETVPKEHLHLPSPDFVDRIWSASDRSPRVLRSIQALFSHGRLAGTGYVSILPVDQGIEHSAGASFAPNPEYFDPEKIVQLAIEGGCNAVASTFGVLGSVGRRYAHRIPFIVKINHNEFLTLPNKFDQILFGTVREAWGVGGV